MMKKALVLGASGGIGYAIVRELVERGMSVAAFARGQEKLEKLYGHNSNIEIFSGDALVEEDMFKAAKGVDIIFHAVGFPYPIWRETHPKCVEIMIKVAKIVNAKIVMADNIYAYSVPKEVGSKVNENALKDPHTEKGKLRLAMENRLNASGVPTLITHLPDLYGPNAENTLLHETLRHVVQNKKANFIGKKNVPREFLYTFDGAKAIVELAYQEQTYNQNWNIPAIHPITGNDLIHILREEFGYTKPVRTITKSVIRFMGIFQPFMKEMVEMMYLNETPVILDGKKYQTQVGEIPKTPYKDGIRETLNWMRERF